MNNSPTQTLQNDQAFAGRAPQMNRCSTRLFGTLPDGSEVLSWTLRNRNGMEVEVLNYGAVIRRISLPKPAGGLFDVVLGYNNIEGYLHDRAWIGAVAGRVAGRITGGRLNLNGTSHYLPVNNPPNHIHGGPDSFNRKLWSGEAISEGTGVCFIYTSPHGEQGYPGDVIISITYTLTDDDEIIFTTEAVSPVATPVSITQHSYFNLAGEDHGDIRDHMLAVFSETIIPTAEDHTLSDRKVFVEGTPSDLRNLTSIRAAISEGSNQHLDFYWFGNAGESKHMARLFSPESGIQMDVFSTHDCLQAYSAMDLHTNHPGKSGRSYQPFSGICLEAESYPNACNVDGFGSILTEPGKVQKHVTTYAFRQRDQEVKS